MKILCFALCALLQTTSSYAWARTAVWSESADCRKYYGKACSEAIGEWLPTFRFNDAAYWDRATHVKERDGFIYEHEKPLVPDALGFQGPDDGTFFVYGTAGPPKGHAVYDYNHHIAFYEQGCCSGQEVVAASGVPAPPKRLVARDLSSLRTVRGIHLGVSVTDVIRIYGRAKALPIPSHPGVSLLAYTTWPPRNRVKTVQLPCGQFENFWFRGGRLILIQLENGC